MDHFHVQSRKFYTGTACGACDKYEVWALNMYMCTHNSQALLQTHLEAVSSNLKCLITVLNIIQPEMALSVR